MWTFIEGILLLSHGQRRLPYRLPEYMGDLIQGYSISSTITNHRVTCRIAIRAKASVCRVRNPEATNVRVELADRDDTQTAVKTAAVLKSRLNMGTFMLNPNGDGVSEVDITTLASLIACMRRTR